MKPKKGTRRGFLRAYSGFFMKKMSIKMRVTLWYTVLMLLIVGLTIGFTAYLGNAALEAEIQKRLIKAVENNADEIIGIDGEIYVDHNFYFIYDEVYCLVFDRSGRLVDGQYPKGFNASVGLTDGEPRTVGSGSERFYVHDRQIDGANGAWVRGVLPDNGENGALGVVKSFSYAIFPFLLIFTVVIGYLISKKAFEPVRQIIDTAEAIGESGDLSKRIALPEGRDEIHSLAETFDGMFERLEKSFEAEKQFTSDASHELRTPITVILAECEYALSAAAKPEEAEEAFEAIDRQARKMSALVNQLLSFTRLEQGTQKVSLETAELSELAESVCEEQEHFNDKSINVIKKIAPAVYAEVDVSLMSRLMQNLISNALRYGRENGTVTVSLKADKGRVIFEVEDDGCGISAEELPKIWNRFYRADSSRSTEGTGLGLSMVKQIAQLHGGEVTAVSEPGRGSSFTFTMPIKD